MASAVVPGGHMLKKLTPGVALLLATCFIVAGMWPSFGTGSQHLHDHAVSRLPNSPHRSTSRVDGQALDGDAGPSDAASRWWWWSNVDDADQQETDAGSLRLAAVRTPAAARPAKVAKGSLERVVDELDGNDARVTAAELHAIMKTDKHRAKAGQRGEPLRVYYNKVGKCGSRSMVSVIRDLALRNSFVSIGSVYGHDLRPNAPRRSRLQVVIKMMPTPMLYHRHVYYFPLTEINPPPLLINMVRHPLDRAVSSYYFRRFGDGKRSGVRGYFDNGTQHVSFNDCVYRGNRECDGARGLWYVVPFFCGASPVCRRPSRKALERAKEVVAEKYLFVGVSEYFDQSVMALEALLPEMFAGAMETWKKQMGDQATKTLNKKPVSAAARAEALAQMTLELEFYEFVKERFFRKLQSLNIPFVRKK